MYSNDISSIDMSLQRAEKPSCVIFWLCTYSGIDHKSDGVSLLRGLTCRP